MVGRWGREVVVGEWGMEEGILLVREFTRRFLSFSHACMAGLGCDGMRYGCCMSLSPSLFLSVCSIA